MHALAYRYSRQSSRLEDETILLYSTPLLYSLASTVLTRRHYPFILYYSTVLVGKYENRKGETQ